MFKMMWTFQKNDVWVEISTPSEYSIRKVVLVEKWPILHANFKILRLSGFTSGTWYIHQNWYSGTPRPIVTDQILILRPQIDFYKNLNVRFFTPKLGLFYHNCGFSEEHVILPKNDDFLSNL